MVSSVDPSVNSVDPLVSSVDPLVSSGFSSFQSRYFFVYLAETLALFVYHRLSLGKISHDCSMTCCNSRFDNTDFCPKKRHTVFGECDAKPGSKSFFQFVDAIDIGCNHQMEPGPDCRVAVTLVFDALEGAEDGDKSASALRAEYALRLNFNRLTTAENLKARLLGEA